MSTLKTVLFSNNQYIVIALRNQLKAQGINLEYLDQKHLDSADLILITKGHVAVCELRRQLIPLYRPKSIVLVRTSKLFRLGEKSGFEASIVKLGYPHVYVAQKDETNDVLAAYALRVILESFNIA